MVSVALKRLWFLILSGGVFERFIWHRNRNCFWLFKSDPSPLEIAAKPDCRLPACRLSLLELVCFAFQWALNEFGHPRRELPWYQVSRMCPQRGFWAARKGGQMAHSLRAAFFERNQRPRQVYFMLFLYKTEGRPGLLFTWVGNHGRPARHGLLGCPACPEIEYWMWRCFAFGLLRSLSLAHRLPNCQHRMWNNQSGPKQSGQKWSTHKKF